MHTIEARRQRDYERFEENRRFEEMTDIAERLGYPIDTTISYEMKDGAAYCVSDTKDRPFHEQTALAKLEGKFTFVGSQAFEYTRLSREHDEALMVDEFGAGKLGGNVLIKFSKVPDAIVSGETDIKGYRRDLLRSFVRVYYRTDAGVDCRLFTLDGADSEAITAVGGIIGINTATQSEAVLADAALLQVPGDLRQFTKELVSATIHTYDQAVYKRTGKQTYAGSLYTDQQNAMQAVVGHEQLMSEHMSALDTIVGLARNDAEREQSLETQRQRTAAAIKLASMGKLVSSIGDATVSAEVAANDYGRECATSMGMNQTGQTMENKWSFGECQVCFVKTSVGSCMVCARCAAADDRGVDLIKLRDRNLRRLTVKKELPTTGIKNTFNQMVKYKKDTNRETQTGLITRRRIVFGGEVTDYLDAQTKEVVKTI